ncbi:MAG: filamentous hemagglutinin N-terminal domain-containing protein [Microcystaceae cyanobacterium]
MLRSYLLRLNIFIWQIPIGIILSHLDAAFLVSAQVSPDNTLNTPSNVQNQGNEIVITGGVTVGNNLFHSFREFSVPNNFEVQFDNVSNVVNIISRVTGTSLSNLEGIVSANGIANLILINPNGIRFGENAQINIGGSFLASTAKNVVFADGSEFSATNPQTSTLLTMSVPVGLQFGSNPGTIMSQATQLGVNPGNTLALVGGKIDFSGGEISVNNGRVEIGSVGSDSQVQLIPTNLGFELSYQGVENFQNISLSNNARIQGNNSDVQLQGQKITLSQRARILTQTDNFQRAGNITIRASESLEIIGDPLEIADDNTLISSSSLNATTTGNSGNIFIHTKRLIVEQGGILTAVTTGQGQGGRLEIDASESVEIVGTGFDAPTLLTTSTGGQGNGGEVKLNTGRLVLQEGGQIVAATAVQSGQGGTITIDASEFIQVSGDGFVIRNNQVRNIRSRISTESGFTDLRLPGLASGGNVNIKTNQLSVTNGGIISSASLGSGNAGNVNITANSIFLDNQGVITASSEGTGNAGSLTIDTDQLTVNNRSEVAVRSIGTGQGGNLTLNAQSISLDDKSKLTATSEALSPETALELELAPELLESDNALANAGSLTITTDNLTINNDSEITVSSFGLGNAGDINVEAQNILLDNSSRLSAETGSGEGGNISLDVDQVLNLRRGSHISTTAGTTGGQGNGGNIDINALFIITVPTEKSDIFANAFLGRGGNITIDAAGVFGIEERQRLTPLSDITASSQFGQVGNIGINRPDVDPQRSLVKLPDEVVDESNVIVDACRPGEALSRGEFTIRGRGGLPSNPNEGVDNPTGLTELGYPNTDSSNSLPSEPGNSLPSEVSPNLSETHTPSIVEAQGWIIDADGNVVLTAQATTVTPHSPGLSPATCYDLSNRNSSP